MHLLNMSHSKNFEKHGSTEICNLKILRHLPFYRWNNFCDFELLRYYTGFNDQLKIVHKGFDISVATFLRSCFIYHHVQDFCSD